MTWIDRIQNTVFTIRTGDGQVYTPDLPIGYETTKEFAAATFEYINLPGAEIARKQVRARQFPLTFVFQGENNIEQAEAFDASCNDPRYWVVRHPLYGDINGQPLGVRRSDTNLNATQFTVDFWETIVTKNPVVALAPQEQLDNNFKEYQNVSASDYESKVDLKPVDVSTIKNNAVEIDAINKKGLDKLHFNAYQETQSSLFTALDDIINQPASAIRLMHEFIISSSRFDIALDTRVNLITSIYNAIGLVLEKSPTPNNKTYFETAGGAAVIALATALINPAPTTYTNRIQVTNAIANLTGLYNNYLGVVNAAYVPINNVSTAFSSSFQTQNILQTSVFSALISLQTIAFNAKIQRSVLLTRDSQLIVLTHKYMGLDANDENIETFRTINNIKNNNVFLIPAGTEIIYYS